MDEDQSFVLDKVRQGLESENISQPLTDEDLERLQWGADNYKIIPEEEWNEWSRKTHWALQVAWLQDTENLQNRNQINEWRVKLAAVVKKGLQKSSMELIVLDSLALHFVEKDLLHDLMHVFGYEDLTEHEKEVMAFFSGAANFGRSRGSKEPNFQSI